MLLIYTPHITNRIKYIMQYVFDERLGIEYSITNSKEEYINNANALKLCYAEENIQHGLFFYPAALLFEEDIKSIELQTGVYNNIQVLFLHNKKAVLNFDVFAAIFYLLSRYEEYLDSPLDKYGNYDYRSSILFKLSVYDKPMVEQWIELLKEVLQEKFPALKFKDHKAKYCLTFDIDVAYAYKNRSIARTAGSFIKNLITLKLNEAKDQLLTLLNKKEDVFDTYDYIFSSIKNKKPVFFFDMGSYGKFDKNPSYRNKNFRQLIKIISEKAITGVHPSYTSNTNKKLVAEEKKKLEQITQKLITKNRQHYLKLKLPETYLTLISNNISEDYTQGYSSTYGFRAGTCNSFLFFDLKKNECTQLRLFPFTYMDVTLNNYLKLDINKAKEVVSNLIKSVCRYKGIFIPLWHNSTLCNCNEWKGWREVFEHTLKEIDAGNLKNLY